MNASKHLHFTVHTDLEVHARRPDMIIVDEDMNQTMMINVAIPIDINIRKKEPEKIIKHEDQAKIRKN